MSPVRVSAMDAAHQALGATFRRVGDWRVPEAYTTPAAEAARARAGAGLVDVSAGEKRALRGEGIEAVLARVIGVDRLAVGTAARPRIAAVPVLTARLAEDEALVLAPPDAPPGTLEELDGTGGGASCAHVFDVSAGYAGVDLVGPAARAVLARVCPLDLAVVSTPLAVAQAGLAGVPAVLIRLGRPAGFRALVARECGAFVWGALVDAGRDLGLTPIGRAARELLDADAVAPPGEASRGAGAR